LVALHISMGFMADELEWNFRDIVWPQLKDLKANVEENGPECFQTALNLWTMISLAYMFCLQ
jgi:hypothetical protein